MAWIQTPVPLSLSDVFRVWHGTEHGAKEDVFWLDSAASTQDSRSMLTLSLRRVVHLSAQGYLSFDDVGLDVAPDLPPWQRLDAALAEFRARAHGNPAGWVGWLSYASGFLGREDLVQAPHPSSLPMAEIFAVEAALIEDAQGTRLVVCAEDHDAAHRLQRQWLDRLSSALEGGEDGGWQRPASLKALDLGSSSRYMHKIAEIQQAISQGAVQQVCLTYPMVFERPASMAAWYAQLRERSPANYCAFVRTSSLEIASTSPESLFEIQGRTVQTRPMKGTRKRGDAPDDILAEDLRTHPKDRAENEMIAAVAQEDLAEVCAPGSVYLRDAFTVETYATVLQLTSTVEGELREDVGPFQAFSALAPPASMTGAPRAQACELLQELEVGARGAYSGCIAWLDGADRSVFSVVIRALQAWEDHAAWHVGGGIIASSKAADEWLESRAKAAALELKDDGAR